MPESAEKTTVDFIRWLFDGAEGPYVHLWAHREAADGSNPEQRYLFYKNCTFNITDDWRENILPRYSVYFCTSAVKEAVRSKDGRNLISGKGASNAYAIASLWVDIDACKKFFNPQTQTALVSGDEFYQDIRTQETDVSAWVRSSEHGIQAHYKLETPFVFDGDKDAFDETARPILQDIAWYWGGDLKTCHVSSMMRLPGSYNRKLAYREARLVTAEVHEERKTTLAKLAGKFKPDLDAVPRAVAYGIIKVIQDFWTEGQRNEAAMALAGSIRQAGLDKGTCLRLYKEIQRVFHDDEFRKAQVEATYSHTEVGALMTVRSAFPESASALDSVLSFWAEFKRDYAKARKLDWTPETYNPLAREDGLPNRIFYERDGQTWYKDKSGTECVAANFTLRFTRRIVKEDGTVNALALLTVRGSPPMQIEVPAALHNTWAKFSTIKPVPSGMGFRAPVLWTDFIMEVNETAIDVPTVRETSYYGLLGSRSNLTVFLPGQERDDYVWAPTMRLFDTAMPGALTKQLTKEQKIAYLAGLAEHLPEYQSPSYLIPALGWFCACPLTALLRHDARLGKGHPTLLITGPKGSGKSTFAAQVLGPHFGCRAARSLAKGATSIFAVKRGLGATNVCPYIGDEFRDEDPVRTTTLGALIRSLWDGEMPSESGTANGEIRIDQLVAPLCIIGESPYTDTANLDRTLCIHVSPAWVQELRQRDRTTFVAAESWLHSDSHHGVLGTLLLDYVNSHMDDVLRTIDAAYARIAATCPTPNERKQKGFVAAYAGLLLLKRVYALYGVPFFLTTKQMLAGIYAADSEVTGTNAGTDPALKQLFRITDSIITNAKRLHASYEGSLYTTRQEDGICYGYFQLSRWFEVVSGAAKISDSAALRNARGFTELLKTDITSEHPCVIDLQSMRGFRREAVEVNLTVMSELYNIDIAAWLETTDY